MRAGSPAAQLDHHPNLPARQVELRWTGRRLAGSLRFADCLSLDSLKITVGIRIYPDTPLCRQAVADGQISADDDLLRPRFYLAPGLEPWLGTELEAWCADRPHWLR
jgi:hypothetical protein